MDRQNQGSKSQVDTDSGARGAVMIDQIPRAALRAVALILDHAPPGFETQWYQQTKRLFDQNDHSGQGGCVLGLLPIGEVFVPSKLVEIPGQTHESTSSTSEAGTYRQT